MDMEKLRVRDLMQTDLKMVRRLPVVDGTALVGILSNTDIFNKLVEHIS